MKICKLSAVILVMVCSSALFAQKDVEVSESMSLMSVGDRPGYTITIEGMSEKDLTRSFKNWIGEKQKKPEIEETGKHELMVNDIVISQISATPIDIYFLFEESKNEIKVTGFFNVNGTFLSSSTQPDKYRECMNMMRSFGLRVEKLKLMETMAIAEKELGKRNEEQKALESKNEQLNDQITECLQTIEKAQSDLEQNAKDQENKKTEIAVQQKTVDTITGELKNYNEY